MGLLEPQKPLRPVDQNRIGDSGTQRFSGYFSEEPQHAWRDEARIDNVETMRRTDATVKQFLTALKTPMLATEYFVEAAGEDPKYIMHKEFVEQNLFNMKRTWKDFMREALTFLDFGFSVFEDIWAIKNGRVCLIDLEPRIQHSILRWQLTDGRRGVVQLVLTDEVAYNHRQVEIPMNKLFVLTNDKEGDDLTGQSVLRPCWKHFTIKDRMYRVSAISAERYGVGVPMITVPEGINDQQKEDAEEMGANLRSNEKGYIVKPTGWEIEILTPKGNPQQGQIDGMIQHHDRMILMAGLAGFLNLGSDSTGSYALSKDQSSFFLKHCEDKLLYICEQITQQIIQRLIIINFGEQDKYPKLTFTPLGDIDFGEYSGTLKTLKDAGYIYKLTSRDYQFVRKTFKMPALTDDEIFEIDQQQIEDELKGVEEENPMPSDSEQEDNMPIPKDEEIDLPEDDTSTEDEGEEEETLSPES
jgi:hypothetical protein